MSYMATSCLDVDINRVIKPGHKMERGLQEILSTGQVLGVLACQLPSSMSHAEVKWL